MGTDTQPDREAMNRPTPWLWTVAGLASVAALAAFIAWAGWPRSLQSLAAAWGSLLIPLIGVHLAFAGPARPRGDFGARVPAILGLATGAYVVAGAVFLLERFLGLSWTGTGVSDLAYLASYAILAVALLFWPSRPVPRRAVPRLVTDALMLFFGASAFYWFLLIGPLLQQSRLETADLVATSAYAFGDLLLVVLLAMAVWRHLAEPLRRPTAVLAGAVFCLIVNDAFFMARLVNHQYLPAVLLDVARPLAFVLLNASAGLLVRALPSTPEPPLPETPWARPGRGRWFQGAPWALVFLSIALVFGAFVTQADRFLTTGVFISVFLVLVTIIAHQILTLRENALLYDGLTQAYQEVRRGREQLRSQNEVLEAANEQLANLALVDNLTGLWNHRAFFEELSRTRRETPTELALLHIDIDFFKQYNDEFGYPAGDEALGAAARAVADALPPNAFLARYGGDEFAVLLRGQAAVDACDAAEAVRLNVAAYPVEHRRLAVSVGWAEWDPSLGSEEAMEAASRALYVAKSMGKNLSHGGDELEMPGVKLLEGGRRVLDLSDDPMAVGRLIVDGLRCDPAAVGAEPSAPLVAGLLTTLELRDADTRRHSERVMWFTLYFAQHLVAEHMPFARQELRALAYGALLHDIGKISLPAALLKTARAYTPEERAEMQSHARLGAEMIAQFEDLHMAMPLIRHHHERWDGRGYPDGLAGEAIPFHARIFTIIDSIDAMSSNRAYSPAMPWADIVQELRAQSGLQFDPALVEAFIRVPRERWDGLRRTQYRLVAPL